MSVLSFCAGVYDNEGFLIQTSVAALLLRYIRWNKERLIEQYMDNGPAIEVAAGISLPSRAPQYSSATSSERSQGLFASARTGGQRHSRQIPGTPSVLHLLVLLHSPPFDLR